MFDRQEQRELLQLARNVLHHFVGRQERIQPDASRLSPVLLQPASTFVTLRHGDQLRGCIGSTHARLAIYLDVARNTIAAARDPRFEPVVGEELPGIHIEISVLGPFQALRYVNLDDLMEHLRPELDGVTVSWQEQRGLLLPQVWERLQEPQQFLQALSQKARIPWKAFDADPPQVEVATFEVIYFSDPSEETLRAKRAWPSER